MAALPKLQAGEEAKAIPDYPDYVVTSLGRVINQRTGRVLKTARCKDGYRSVVISRGARWARRSRGWKVHQLVLAAFVGPRPRGMLSRHLNDVPDDNRLENLRYGTPRDNMNDARFLRGLDLLPVPPPPQVRPWQKGESNRNAKITENGARFIRANYRPWSREGGSYNGLARKFGISPNAVRDIVRGINWSYLADAEQPRPQAA